MSENDCFSSIREDVKNRPEGKGVRLENCDFVIGPRTFAVFTFYVDYADRSSFKTPPGVIKFSEKKYAIPNQENNTIQLGSFRYYRKHEDDNIADPEEGKLIQRGPFSEICESNGVPSKPWFKYVSSTVTWKRPDILMFCTSALRETQSFGELQSQFPNYDCATLIPDPSKFAMQLGKDVGSKLDMANVHLSGLDRIKQVSESYGAGVWVHLRTFNVTASQAGVGDEWLASIIIHDACHVHQFEAGQIYYGLEAERDCAQIQLEALGIINPQDSFQFGLPVVLANIDDPAYQWWR